MKAGLQIGAEILEREAGIRTRRSRIDWALANRRARTSLGAWGPLDFDRWPFQRDLYLDEHPEIVIRKAAQMGASEWAVSEALYATDELGLTAMYVLPAWKPDTIDFSADRVAPAIRNSPVASRTRNVDNVGLRQIGPTGSLYMRGSREETHLSSVPVDCLIVDEHDLCVTANLPAAERRLGASRLGWRRWIGVPYIPDRGIDRRFAESDRRQWLVSCASCSREQVLDWTANVVIRSDGTAFRACASCGVELLASDVAAGRWVAEHPGRSVHGYAMSKLIRPDVDLAVLVKASRQTGAGEVEAFHRYDLGTAYTSPGARLTREEIAAAVRKGQAAGAGEARFGQTPEIPDGVRLVAGVDVGGRYLRVWLAELAAGKTLRLRWCGSLVDQPGYDAFAQLGLWLHALPIVRCVIDALPEERKTRELCDLYPGVVYRCTYNADPKRPQDVQVTEAESMVVVKRTESLDATFAHVRSGDELWPPALEHVPDALAELCEPVRVVVEDTRGNPIARYAGDGADHLAHALNYARIAARIYGHGEGPILEVV